MQILTAAILMTKMKRIFRGASGRLAAGWPPRSIRRALCTVSYRIGSPLRVVSEACRTFGMTPCKGIRLARERIRLPRDPVLDAHGAATFMNAFYNTIRND
ncbi:hypothetical protein [Burkholderia oklahomensis]|uniref:hypothetical protein n=1 Tax=Burkholderia oklahomensis TaxID=342113 RepID=UPI0011982733|nr:hypothetical protein [Burkholderia oklahomensis]QPS40701.1 hypothetical protein I6G57_20485 [Burkholderia oklahomensis]